MPAENGSVTPSVAAAATAASTALPPLRSTSRPTRVASASTVATAPPVPTAAGVFTTLRGSACAGAPVTNREIAEAAATEAVRYLARCRMVAPVARHLRCVRTGVPPAERTTSDTTWVVMDVVGQDIPIANRA